MGQRLGRPPKAAPSARPATLGARLRVARQRAGLTQLDAASRIPGGGWSSGSISQWECDYRAPPLSVLEQLATIYGLTAQMLWDPTVSYAQAPDWLLP